MISYKPFYETLLRKGVTEYYLIYKQGMDSNTIHRMKHGKAITTTLNTLCEILDCRVEDIERVYRHLLTMAETGVTGPRYLHMGQRSSEKEVL